MYTYVPNLPRIQIIIEKKGGGEGRGNARPCYNTCKWEREWE